MNDPCDKLDAFFDGRLDDAAHAAFRLHLAGCARCGRELAELSALEGLVGAHADSLRKPTVVALAPRRRRSLAAVAALGVAAAAATAIMVVPHDQKKGASTAPSSSAAIALADAKTRPFEARLAYAPADRYRPYDVDRASGGGAAHEAIALEALAALEKQHDLHGVAAGLLLSGERDRAADYLARAGEGAGVDIDRAVVAMQSGRVDDALEIFDRVLTRDPKATQALWNEGLVFRQLGLDLLAADAFDRVAALGEAGWSDEARARATALRDAFHARTQAWFDTKKAMLAMVAGTGAPTEDILRAQPTYARHWLYEALRAATTRERAQALAPLAARLDSSDGALAHYASRVAARDFSRRAPLAARYAKLVATSGSLDAAAVEKLAADLRASGDDDILFGLRFLSHGEAAHARELRALAAASADPWLLGLADAAEAQAAIDRVDFARAETILRAAIARVEAARFEYLAAKLELAIATLFARVHRPVEARAFAESGIRRGRAHALDQEYSLNFLLGDIARLSGLPARMKAHLLDGELRAPEACAARRYVHETLAVERVLVLDAAGANDELRRAPRCDQPLTLIRADAIVNVARMLGDAEGLATLPADLEAARGALSPSDQALSSVIEARALMIADRAAGEALARRAFAATEKSSPGDAAAMKARTYARLTLAIEAARAGDGDGAFAAIAGDASAGPSTRCALAVAVDDARAVAVARDADGKSTLHYEAMRPSSAIDPALLVPEPLRTALGACPAVAVFAMPPVHGRPQLLPREIAWSYRSTTKPAPPTATPSATIERRLIVAGVEPPASLGLAPLGTWTPATSVDAHTTLLQGASATPGRVLTEMGDASEVVVHAHGFVDLGISDASLIALSPDASGRFALTAADVRARALTRHPVVVLGACSAAQTAPYLHESWSMPVAFVDAGARAVFASPAPIRDAEASAFFEVILASIRAGKSPAEALRDARARAASSADWTSSVLVFD